MGGVAQSEAVAVAQSAVHFRAENKILTAEIAAFRGRFKGQRPACRQSVAKFPRLIRQVLFGDDIFGKIPAFGVAGKNQLQLDFALVFASRFTIRVREVRFPIVTNHFLQGLVRSVDVFELGVYHRINPVLVLQHAKPVFPFKSRVHRAVMKRSLCVEVKFRRPPGIDAILKLGPVGMEIVSGALRAERREIFDLKVSGLLEIMVVSDKVWVFLGLQGARKDRENQHKRGNEGNSNVVQANLLVKHSLE